MIHPEQVPSHLADLAPYFTIAGEAQVIDLSRRTHYGPWIKLRVEHIEQLAGVEPGQRYQLLMVKLEDDDMPASNEHKPYRLSQKAGMLCADEQFRHWITQAYGDPCHDKDAAAQWLRESCGVESRSYLDANETAAEIFRAIMKDYDQYKQQVEGGGRMMAKPKHREPLKNTWYQMLLRCENPENHNYRHYGGRGIKVCDRWQSLANFVSDMGSRPPGTTLDRIDTLGNYEPGNCRWVDQRTQMNNARLNRKLVIRGEELNLAEAARKYGIDNRLLWARIEILGWTEERAATTPKRRVKKYLHWTHKARALRAA